MDKQLVIEVAGISKYYGMKAAVSDVSLQIGQGELFGLVGGAGAGKTTLLELITGMKVADQGSISILGNDVLFQYDEVKEELGMHIQGTGLVESMDVREALELFQSFYKRQYGIDRLIELMGLELYADKRIKRLSGGLRQRVMLAIALVNDPSVIVLDEPTIGLDLEAKEHYWTLLSKLQAQGKTIVIASHDMEQVQRYCCRVGVMRQGQLLACDPPQSLISGLPGGGLTMEAVYMYHY